MVCPGHHERSLRNPGSRWRGALGGAAHEMDPGTGPGARLVYPGDRWPQTAWLKLAGE